MLINTLPRFLIFSDYSALIQKEDLFQILSNENFQEQDDFYWNIDEYTFQTLLEVENTAQEEISSYLRGRYLTEQIFSPTQVFQTGTTYYGNNLITYSADRFCTGTTYTQGNRFSYCGIIYQVIATGQTSGITPSYTASTLYSAITNNNAFYYANLPVPEWSENANYVIGNVVWYKNQFYIATQNVRGINPHQSQNLELYYGEPSVLYQGATDQNFYNSVFPLNQNNVPPKQSNVWNNYSGFSNTYYTATSNVYSFSITGTPDTSPFFTKGDNRNPQVKMYMVDIILYHLHSRINPRNIPELRERRYVDVIEWLKRVEAGKVNLQAPERTPKSAHGSIRWGSTQKRNNFY